MKSYLLLNTNESAEIANKVRSLQEHWVNRGGYFAYPFFSLGAASYMDAYEDPERYYKWAEKFNPILEENFAPLYLKVQNFFEEYLKHKCSYKKDFAIPGFHIFAGDEIFEITVASRHCDLQYELLNWKEMRFDPKDALSFTLYIQLPKNGGGMYVWDYSYDDLKDLSTEDRKNKLDDSKPHYAKFNTGEIVIHSGLKYHQIAAMTEPDESDMRISLQGHMIKSNDTYYMYW